MPTCGTSLELAKREQQLHREYAKERKGFISQEQAVREGYTPPLVPPHLKWAIAIIGLAIMSIHALFATLDPKPDGRLLNTTPAIGFDIFLPIGLVGIAFCMFQMARSR